MVGPSLWRSLALLLPAMVLGRAAQAQQPAPTIDRTVLRRPATRRPTYKELDARNDEDAAAFRGEGAGGRTQRRHRS